MPINVNYKHPLIACIKSWIQHYDHHKYWKYREFVTDPHRKIGWGKITLIIKYFLLLYVKRCDAFNNASTGADLNAGALFKTPPKLPHGLYGIIVSPHAKIGANVRIYHQVSIADDGKNPYNVPIIGDNVIIGAGAKIIGKVTIGDNAKIGAGAIVVNDVPSGAVAISPKAKIIIKSEVSG